VIDKKTQALACHASQKQWLDESQGMERYLDTMLNESRNRREMKRHVKNTPKDAGDVSITALRQRTTNPLRKVAQAFCRRNIKIP